MMTSDLGSLVGEIVLYTHYDKAQLPAIVLWERREEDGWEAMMFVFGYTLGGSTMPRVVNAFYSEEQRDETWRFRGPGAVRP